MTTNTKQASNRDTGRNLVVAALVLLSFFGAYRFASASAAAASGGASQASGLGGIVSAASGAGGGGCGMGCCGGGGSSTPITGAAVVEGGVQKISVDATQGYNPNTIELQAGIPAEITFSQASGCTAVVYSADLGFQEDLTTGPKTVKLNGLSAGTYNFACGMDMVRGTIVVQ